MYGCESWTIKKAKHGRIDTFELWCWRRLLRVPWKTRSNQSILKEISLEYSLERLMLKLKLQYFGHLSQELTHWKRPWCWERLKAGREGNDRGWDGWMAWPTHAIQLMDMSLSIHCCGNCHYPHCISMTSCRRTPGGNHLCLSASRHKYALEQKNYTSDLRKKRPAPCVMFYFCLNEMLGYSV